ncbi:MAG: LysM peptidoglycan-binding domain-containing protein [Bacteroidetes bacterium]|nr:LysM peptidoglycan-binding domain-containing protein [Bacteroidota bacterium]
MNVYKIFAALFSVLLFCTIISAQDRKEMTEEEWQAEIQRLSTKKVELTQELATLKTEIATLKTNNAALQAQDDCINEMYALVGATKADVDNFRSRLNELMSQVDGKVSPKDDRLAEWEALKASKISALPEFFDKIHNQLGRKLDSWQEKPAEVIYTVVKGDCLWYIAKRDAHYGNGFAWPKIYQANRDQIKNPDLIYPAQIFKVPNLTDDEKEHYAKVKRNYKPAPVQQ